MPIPSPVYHKLRLNVKLTNEEETQVRRAMSESFSKLKAVESETARLRDRLIVLSQRKKDTEDFIKIHQSLLSPIRRLHPDILQEIFCRCLPTAHNSVLSFKEAPLLLGRVCSQWRQIAYSTPALWSSLHISTVPLTSPGARARFEAFDAWLSRSGILPLSISMSTYMEHDSQESRPYFNLIAKHVRRWKCIHLQVELLDSVHLPLEINADNLPLLEVFCIRARHEAAHFLLKKDCILMAPSLHILSIHESSLRLLDLPVQWSKLTGLDSACSNLADILKLLSFCSNLETCALNVGDSYPPYTSMTMAVSPDSGPKVVLPRLQTLSIYGAEFNHNNGLLTILHNLFTPALRHFACQLSNFSLPSDPNPLLQEHLPPLPNVFSSFFQRLNQPLEELDFYDYGDEPNYLMDLLYLCPGLKKLLYTSDSSERLFNDRLLLKFIPYEHRSHCHSCSLVEEHGGQVEMDGSVFPSFTCLCPNLEVLHLDSAYFSKHILLEFLHSRLVDYEKYDTARLRRFSISFDSRWGDDDMTWEINRLAEKSRLLVKLEHSPAPVPTPPLYPPSLYRDPFVQELPVF